MIKTIKIILLFILWFITVLTINLITLKLGLNIQGRSVICFIVGLIFGIIAGNIIMEEENE